MRGDPLVAEMAAKSPAPVVYFSIAADHPVVVAHRAAGGRAVTVRDGIIMLCEGELEIPLVRLDRVPLTQGGRIAFQVENTLAAVGAAWSLGLTREAIRSGLESFTADIEHVPGRFNLLDIGGVTVIVDYGHNPSSLMALTAAMDQFPHERRTAVYTCAGDRRDCDMIRQGELLGRAFDRVMLYEDHYVRGRKEGEIMGLLKQGLTGAKRALEIQEIRGSVAAIETGAGLVRPGELLMIQADTIDETVDYVRRYLATHRTATRSACWKSSTAASRTMRIDARLAAKPRRSHDGAERGLSRRVVAIFTKFLTGRGGKFTTLRPPRGLASSCVLEDSAKIVIKSPSNLIAGSANFVNDWIEGHGLPFQEFGGRANDRRFKAGSANRFDALTELGVRNMRAVLRKEKIHPVHGCDRDVKRIGPSLRRQRHATHQNHQQGCRRRRSNQAGARVRQSLIGECEASGSPSPDSSMTNCETNNSKS